MYASKDEDMDMDKDMKYLWMTNSYQFCGEMLEETLFELPRWWYD